MIGEHLRKRNKRTYLVVNKVDNIDPDMARYADNLACLTERLPAPLLLEIPHGS